MTIEKYQRQKSSITLWSIPVLPLIMLGILAVITSSVDTPVPVETNTPAVSTSEFLKKKVFGESTQGKPIEGYEIGTGENTLLLFGAIHGRERGTVDLLNNLIEELAASSSLVALDKKILIIPVMNPDGYYDRDDKLNANDVNLNLNFPTTDWTQYGGDEGHFAGASPFSENESRVMRQIVDEYKPYAMISFHSQGKLISPEATDASIALAKWYAQKSGYEYFDEWNYAGTATRWFEETTGKPAITVELSEHDASDWELNREALLELVSRNLSDLIDLQK